MRRTRPNSSADPGRGTSPAGWSAPATRCLAVAVAFLGVAGGSACGPSCDTSSQNNPEETYSGGTVTAGVYSSSPWQSGYLPFPGGKRYAFEHRLGAVPAEVNVYFAFDASPSEESPCAGNTCVFAVDGAFIHLRNDTCAEFWVRVTASGRLGAPADAGAE
jgi:hypothetical protein